MSSWRATRNLKQELVRVGLAWWYPREETATGDAQMNGVDEAVYEDLKPAAKAQETVYSSDLMKRHHAHRCRPAEGE